MAELWTIRVHEGYPLAGQPIELFDENEAPIQIDDLSIVMKLKGWRADRVFSISSGNFTVVPPVSPATHPTKWLFSLTQENVHCLKSEENKAEVIIADQNGAYVASFDAVILKR